jgi:hypothetical protein
VVAGEGAQIRITWQDWQLRCYQEHAYALLRPSCRRFFYRLAGEAEVILLACMAYCI